MSRLTFIANFVTGESSQCSRALRQSQGSSRRNVRSIKHKNNTFWEIEAEMAEHNLDRKKWTRAIALYPGASVQLIQHLSYSGAWKHVDASVLPVRYRTR